MDDLEVIQDERAIRRLLAHYADAVARKDQEKLRGLFAPDAVVVIANGPPRTGVDAIVAGFARTISAFSFLHQRCEGNLIDVSGNCGRSRSSVLEMNRAIGEDKLNLIFGIYEDEFRQDGGGWRFSSRRFTMQCRAVVPSVDFDDFPSFLPAFGINA